MDSLFEMIERLQKQPAHIRRRVLYVTTASLSSLIFFFWLSLFPSTLERIQNRSNSASNVATPFAALLGTLKETKEGLSGMSDSVGSELKYFRSKVVAPTSTPKATLEPVPVDASSTATTTPPNEASE